MEKRAAETGGCHNFSESVGNKRSLQRFGHAQRCQDSGYTYQLALFLGAFRRLRKKMNFFTSLAERPGRSPGARLRLPLWAADHWCARVRG